MIDLTNDIPLKEKIIERLGVLTSQIRTISLEIDALVKTASQEKVFLTKQEVAEMLHCEPRHVPKKIPRFRVGNTYLIDSSDLTAFINNAKR